LFPAESYACTVTGGARSGAGGIPRRAALSRARRSIRCSMVSPPKARATASGFPTSLVGGVIASIFFSVKTGAGGGVVAAGFFSMSMRPIRFAPWLLW
jgi:hypothetical protein